MVYLNFFLKLKRTSNFSNRYTNLYEKREQKKDSLILRVSVNLNESKGNNFRNQTKKFFFGNLPKKGMLDAISRELYD